MNIGLYTTSPTDLFDDSDNEGVVNDVMGLASKFGHVIGIRYKDEREETPSFESVLGISNIIIACPFTSVVIESACLGIPGFWYDPYGKCKKSRYFGTNYLAVGIEELYSKFKFWRSMSAEKVREFALFNELDPYCDTGAKDRFRDIIVEMNTRPSIIKCTHKDRFDCSYRIVQPTSIEDSISDGIASRMVWCMKLKMEDGEMIQYCERTKDK